MFRAEIDALKPGDEVWTRGKIVIGEGLFVLHKPLKCEVVQVHETKTETRIEVVIQPEEGPHYSALMKPYHILKSEKSAKRRWTIRRKQMLATLADFQETVRASLEEDVKPQFEHDCDNCVFLGRFTNTTYWNPGEYDLYVCERENDISLIARFGKEGDYASMPLMDGMTLSPILREVFKRARNRGYCIGWEIGGTARVENLKHEKGLWPTVVKVGK